MDRFIVVDGSQSCHCCFEVTVVDTTKPNDYHQFESICECFDKDDALFIAAALNRMENS